MPLKERGVIEPERDDVSTAAYVRQLSGDHRARTDDEPRIPTAADLAEVPRLFLRKPSHATPYRGAHAHGGDRVRTIRVIRSLGEHCLTRARAPIGHRLWIGIQIRISGLVGGTAVLGNRFIGAIPALSIVLRRRLLVQPRV